MPSPLPRLLASHASSLRALQKELQAAYWTSIQAVFPPVRWSLRLRKTAQACVWGGAKLLWSQPLRRSVVLGAAAAFAWWRAIQRTALDPTAPVLNWLVPSLEAAFLVGIIAPFLLGGWRCLPFALRMHFSPSPSRGLLALHVSLYLQTSAHRPLAAAQAVRISRRCITQEPLPAELAVVSLEAPGLYLALHDTHGRPLFLLNLADGRVAAHQHPLLTQQAVLTELVERWCLTLKHQGLLGELSHLFSLVNEELFPQQFPSAAAPRPEDGACQNERNGPPPPAAPPVNDAMTSARAVLGLAPGFTPTELKAAWRSAASKYHPDKHENAPFALKQLAQNQMQRVNEAYRLLAAPTRPPR